MKNNGLQIVKNQNFNVRPKNSSAELKKKKYFIRFTLFITSLLLVFGCVFFVKDKVNNIREFQRGLDFQKQKLIEERVSVEKKSEELTKLKSEYENKNKELNDNLNAIKEKEKHLDAELNKARQLSDIFKKQIVDMYGFDLDKKYDKKDEDSLHTNGVVGGNDKEDAIANNEKILSVADADWFMKMDSLGEFPY